MAYRQFIELAGDLELAGLIWNPEIGDEISPRGKPDFISVLVDPEGLSPSQLRSTYLWLPTVEQMVLQFEARQALLFHAGLELTEHAMHYKTVVKVGGEAIEVTGPTLRAAVGVALRDLLLLSRDGVVN